MVIKYYKYQSNGKKGEKPNGTKKQKYNCNNWYTGWIPIRLNKLKWAHKPEYIEYKESTKRRDRLLHDVTQVLSLKPIPMHFLTNQCRSWLEQDVNDTDKHQTSQGSIKIKYEYVTFI